MADLNLSRGSSDERGRLATIVDGLDLPVGAMNPAARADYITRMQQRREARLVGLQRAAGSAGAMLSNIEERLGGRGGANPDQHAGNINLGGAPDLATRAAQLKASGMTKDQARQQLVKEGLLPP